jgi:hypothetical protein
MKKIEDGWECENAKGAKKCLSGLDDQGRVSASVRFYCWSCEVENRIIRFCEKCTKADLVITLLEQFTK